MCLQRRQEDDGNDFEFAIDISDRLLSSIKFLK